MKDTQSRKWQITINFKNQKQIDHSAIKDKLSALKSIVYYCMADEIGLKENTPHTHIYIACSSPLRFSTIKRAFPEGHIEQARGSCEENKAYIEKSGKWQDDPKSDTSIKGTFEEGGEMPFERQGARSDLDLLYTLVKDGKSNFEILEENSDYLLRLTDIERVRQTLLSERYSAENRNLEVFYIFGATGTGKTRGIYEKHNPRDICRSL